METWSSVFIFSYTRKRVITKNQMSQTTMQLAITKTQILTIFIIVFNQLLPIVAAQVADESQVPQPSIPSQTLESSGRSHHHPNPSHHDQAPTHSAKSEEDKREKPSHHNYSRGQELEFLTAHNKHRSRIGHPPLIWDVNLAAFAQWWAKKRKGDCAIIHARRGYGENIFWGGHDHWTATEVVDLWAAEDQFYDAVTNKCQPEQLCGHYTQIIWRTSSRLGCSRKKCRTGGVFVICCYDPPGNIHGSNPFWPARHGTAENESSSLPPISSLPPPEAAPTTHL